jgi:hypothetical protein
VLLRQSCILIVGLLLLPVVGAAQEGVPAIPVSQGYAPPTAGDRLTWVVEGTASLPVIAVNTVDSAWSTDVNWPQEWGRGFKGFGRRFGDEEAYATVADAIEASVGAIWSEDPRYKPSGQRSTWRRVHHAVMATVLAPRRDGHLAPAWGRFTAIAAATEIEDEWLPPSARTPGETAWRVADDLIGRTLSNVWDEFWPDVRKWLPAFSK